MHGQIYMSYKVLSLKWRPQTFDDIVGQDHVTKTLTNAFKLDRVAAVLDRKSVV